MLVVLFGIPGILDCNLGTHFMSQNIQAGLKQGTQQKFYLPLRLQDGCLKELFQGALKLVKSH